MPFPLTKEILDDLSAQYGDSFYILDSDRFAQNCAELIESFRACYSKFNIAYSYKTNYTPKLVKIVNQFGGYAEIVSDMELEIALRVGVNPEHIIWNGPVKNKKKVQELLLRGGTVNLDSVYELEFIRTVADNHAGQTLNIGLRVNYDIGDGVLSRFGFDIDGEDFDNALRTIAGIANLKLVNIQAHFAKRSPAYWTARAEGMLRTYEKVVGQYGLKPERLDIGGGIFGKMPESLRNQLKVDETSFDCYAAAAAKRFAEHFQGSNEIPWLFIEPGTAVAGDCMRFVNRVETIKTIRGKTIATLSGSQKNISMSGINPPMIVIPCGREQRHYVNADLVGYTCIENDILQKNYSGQLAVGDYVVFGNCGSYSLVMKPPFILPNFPVLDISSGKVEVIKRAETFSDLFHTYSF